MEVFVVLEDYDNGLEWDDHYSYKDKFIALYSSLDDAIENINKDVECMGNYSVDNEYFAPRDELSIALIGNNEETIIRRIVSFTI